MFFVDFRVTPKDSSPIRRRFVADSWPIRRRFVADLSPDQLGDEWERPKPPLGLLGAMEAGKVVALYISL